MIEIPQAVISLYPEAQFVGPANNGGYDDIRWHVKPDGITKAKVETELVRLNAEFTANEYSRNRAKAYDSVGNQLDMLMKDMKNGTTTHQEACEAVKAKYPKP
jgi:hypothetical protein